jgi:hypothetical protein
MTTAAMTTPQCCGTCRKRENTMPPPAICPTTYVNDTMIATSAATERTDSENRSPTNSGTVNLPHLRR